jgi:hypothetical protein
MSEQHIVAMAGEGGQAAFRGAPAGGYGSGTSNMWPWQEE